MSKPRKQENNPKRQSRRKFLSQSALATFGSLLGTKIVFAENFPKDLSPVGLLPENAEPLEELKGKNTDFTILNDKPINAEPAPHVLDPEITPYESFFVRNNGLTPQNLDANNWTLTIEGESAKTKKTYTINDLKTKFTTHTFQLVIECGGNGRKEFNPPAKGNQWSLGAVACAQWTGVKLKDVLNDAGIKADAVYIGYYGADKHISGDPDKVVISRGVPIKKAMDDENLIAWAMNGKDIPLIHGFPLRLVIGGWPASTSGKWLNKIVIRNKIHDGPKMGGNAYRVPKYPVEPGQKVPDEDMKIIEAMPIKSLITYPKSGAMVKGNQLFEVRGHAWAGDVAVKKVEISIDFGATWQPCNLKQAANKNAWQRFSTQVSLPENGYYEIWAKATDENNVSQPMVVPGWNPKGYLNNACHRIAVKRT